MKPNTIALGALALLAGCGAGGGVTGTGEPSRDDMQRAVLHYIMGPQSTADGNDRIWFKGKSGRQQFIKVTKTACTKGADAPGFACDFKAETCVTGGSDCELTTVVTSGRFVKGEDGAWQYVANASAPPVPRPVDLADMMELNDAIQNGGPTACMQGSVQGYQREVLLRLGAKPC